MATNKETLDKVLTILNMPMWAKRFIEKIVNDSNLSDENIRKDLNEYKENNDNALKNKADLIDGKIPESQLPDYADVSKLYEEIQKQINELKDSDSETAELLQSINNAINQHLQRLNNIEQNYATKEHVENRLQDIIGTAPENLDTLGEIADALKDNDDAVAGIITTLASKADKKETESKLDSLTKSVETNTNKLAEYPNPSDILTSKQAAAKYFPLTDGQDLEHLVDTLNEGLGQVEKDLENDYCRRDGKYPDLTAGTAQNLLGKVDITNSSMYRTVGGDESVVSGFEAASIESIQGNSVAWNQQIQNGNFANGLDFWNIGRVSVTTSNNVATIDFNSVESNKWIVYNLDRIVVENHTYLLMGELSAENDSSGRVILFFDRAIQSDLVSTNKKTKISIISVAKTPYANNPRIAITGDGICKASNFNIFDLTLIYGAGNEPTTAEQFEADYQRWFGKPLTYEEYDEGSIRPVLATGIKTVGFNLYSGGDFSGSTSEWLNKILWKNDCGYTGQMFIQADVETSIEDTRPSIVVHYTDGTTNSFSAGNVVKGTIKLQTSKDKIVDTINCGYNKKDTAISVKNICINFSWSGNRDGEYEPHWEETKALPLTTLTGKLNGEGESVVVFPDGMKRAGNVYDEIKVENGVTKAIKRVGSVDLGTLSWVITRETFGEFNSHSITNSLARIDFNPNIISGKYIVGRFSGNNGDDKAMLTTSNGVIYIRDSHYAYKSVDEFAQSLQGIIFYYELAEPEEYILDNFELPMVYKVDDFGTEQIISPENSITPTLIIKYGVNAVDTIRNISQKYISAKSDDNFLTELGKVTNSKWSREWDANLNSYNFKSIKEFATINVNENYDSSGVTIHPNDRIAFAAISSIDKIKINIVLDEWNIGDKAIIYSGNELDVSEFALQNPVSIMQSSLAEQVGGTGIWYTTIECIFKNETDTILQANRESLTTGNTAIINILSRNKLLVAEVD